MYSFRIIVERKVLLHVHFPVSRCCFFMNGPLGHNQLQSSEALLLFHEWLPSSLNSPGYGIFFKVPEPRSNTNAQSGHAWS